MSLPVKDTVTSSLERMFSKASAGVLTLILALPIIFFITAELVMTASVISPAVAGMIGSLGFLSIVGTVAALTTGSFRAFNQKDLKAEMFTKDILRPFLRIMGVGIVIQAFLTFAFTLILYPMILLSSGIQPNILLGPETGLIFYAYSGLILLSSTVIILSLLTFFIVSIPNISINNDRTFRAIDRSIQLTRGNRLRILAALLPSPIFMALGLVSVVALGIVGVLPYLILSLLAVLYTLALSVELNSRLG